MRSTAPFGSLMAGAMAARIGAPRTPEIGGAICLAGAAIFARRLLAIRALMRPVYVELGIRLEE
ncbi:MAG: hypothetical protein ABSC23_08345 [Bryobacteraceae bacterium]